MKVLDAQETRAAGFGLKHLLDEQEKAGTTFASDSGLLWTFSVRKMVRGTGLKYAFTMLK